MIMQESLFPTLVKNSRIRKQNEIPTKDIVERWANSLKLNGRQKKEIRRLIREEGDHPAIDYIDGIESEMFGNIEMWRKKDRAVYKHLRLRIGFQICYKTDMPSRGDPGVRFSRIKKKLPKSKIHGMKMD